MPGPQGPEPPSALPALVVLTFTVTVLPVDPPRTTVTPTPVLPSFTTYVEVENRTLGSLSLMSRVATLGLPSVALPEGVPSVTTTLLRPSTSVLLRTVSGREALVWLGAKGSDPLVGPL